MTQRIDARGLSCPQPVVVTNSHMQKIGSGAFEVLVDTGTARDNIARLAASNGWSLEVRQEGEDFVLALKK
jgi:TusA-related sulfurtransferase